MKSGVDVGISYEKAYMESMTENINEGKVNISTIDRAVRRILLQKFRLGLFENPYVDADNAERLFIQQIIRNLHLRQPMRALFFSKMKTTFSR